MADSKIIIEDPTITTIGEFIANTENYNVVATVTGRQGTATDLLNYRGSTSQTNRERVFSRYIGTEKEDQEGVADADLLLKLQTVLYIPNSEIRKELLYSSNNQVISNSDTKAFVASFIRKLLIAPSYTKSYNLKTNQGVVKDIILDYSVYIWCRALSNPSSNDNEGTFLNITPFVENLNTNSGENGANFTIKLSPLICHYQEDTGWTVTNENIKNFAKNANNFVSDVPMFEGDAEFGKKSTLKRSKIFFHYVIQENDVVWITYETLDIEKDNREATNRKFQLQNTDIPNKIYDMIGFIDGNNQNINFEANDISVNLTGRDFTKLIIEDGSYFFPLEFANGVFYNNANTSATANNNANSPNNTRRDKLLQRSAVNGSITTLNAYKNKTIDFIMKFIISQLSNTGLVPDVVFSGYSTDVRSRTYKLAGEENDAEVAIGQTNTTKTVTLGNKFGEFQDGAWQIVKVLIDQSVENRIIVDTSIAQEQGSIINSIRKMCQWPFVEFFTDTYGDQFYFIIRKPPFDRKSWLGLLYDDIQEESKDAGATGVTDLSKKVGGNIGKIPNIGITNLASIQKDNNFSDLLIDIEEEDILQEDLSFNQDEVYTWYRVQPGGLLWGTNTQMTWAFLPAIYFPEYVDVWGSKPLMIESNYISADKFEDADDNDKQNYIERQAIRDLAYVIECHAYLPFTRKGTITINGDRRIKRNFCIRHKGTNEIYYVREVTNNASIDTQSVDRTTTLVLDRGMKEEYIRGKQVPGIRKPVSYFNIINTDVEESFSQIKLTGPRNITKVAATVSENFIVDKDIFNFFLNRRQFS